MNFSRALEIITRRGRVARSGWNGRGMSVFLVDDATYAGGSVVLQPFLAMRTVPGEIVPWLASQTDLLADDWSEVE